MKFLFTIFAICLYISMVAGQHFLFGQLPTRGSQFNFNGFDTNSAPNVRDPRQNRGPVVFPSSPPNPNDESSGVIVGASGYGFVPPQSHAYYTAALESPGASYAAYDFYSSPYSSRYTFF